jgi:hypothetical protein
MLQIIGTRSNRQPPPPQKKRETERRKRKEKERKRKGKRKEKERKKKDFQNCLIHRQLVLTLRNQSIQFVQMLCRKLPT